MGDVRRAKWLLGAVAAILGGFLTLASPSAAPAAEGARVAMVDNEPDLTNWHFDPAEVTVPAGSTVVWVNQGEQDHTVTADDQSFDSGYKKKGATFERAFARPGRYSYHCAPHPWMKGTVVVVVAAAAAVPATRSATADTGPATTAPAAGATGTTFPPSLATQPPPSAAETTTSAAVATTTPPANGSGDESSAAPAASRRRAGGNLAATLAVVVLPTLGALAIGARLRRRKVHQSMGEMS
jgi:plastocyanin